MVCGRGGAAEGDAVARSRRRRGRRWSRGGVAACHADCPRTSRRALRKRRYARAAALAAAASPAALPKNAPFFALAVPQQGRLQCLAVYRPSATADVGARANVDRPNVAETSTGCSDTKKPCFSAQVGAWLDRASARAADDLKAAATAASERALADEQKREICEATRSDRAAAASAAADRAAAAAAEAERAAAAAAAERRAAAEIQRRAALADALPPEPDGAGVLVKLRCPDGDTRTRKFDAAAPSGAVLDWCDACGVDLDAFAIRKAAGDKARVDDRKRPVGELLGSRALLECVSL